MQAAMQTVGRLPSSLPPALRLGPR